MATDTEKRAELIEHLAELRTRIIRSLIYVGIGMLVAYFFSDWFIGVLTRQLKEVLHASHGRMIFTSITEAFTLKLQVAFVGGLILASPLVMTELWRFVAPGLTASEKRPLRWIAPLSVFLFIGGAAVCYSILSMAFKWFASFTPPDVDIYQSLPAGIRFVLLMLVAFGCGFELPVVLMLLAQIGIVNSKVLKKNWKHAVVAISIVAAAATPSNDILSMMTMTVPLVILYLLSIWLVKFVERKPSTE